MVATLRYTMFALCWYSSVCLNIFSTRSMLDGASLGTLNQSASWQWFCRMPRSGLQSQSCASVNAHCLKIKIQILINSNAK